MTLPRPPPKPFSGLAAGCQYCLVAPHRARAITSALTSGGKDLRSFSDEPTHLTGFSFSLSIILLYVYLYICQEHGRLIVVSLSPAAHWRQAYHSSAFLDGDADGELYRRFI